ncbi:hypothetical protein C7N43_35650 [Sphingobacteriales bacterium UPWRP_1]|nr:hypothetical protein C7N43_35650 [Sphingobacteriales bacterium UPWRP_1]
MVLPITGLPKTCYRNTTAFYIQTRQFMAKDLIYKIEGLKCAYRSANSEARTVLEIGSLQIPKNKMVFVLGRSGVGKSTILEALGLMNNTIVSGSDVQFTPTAQERYDFSGIWEAAKKDALSKVRNNHFSFIFQETNLMPNFTVYENICFTQMLQGVTYRQALDKVKQAMKDVGLSGIEEHKKVYELSGGQKQRVAFVRAITPRFTVLFGDEPTGNLDENNATELMSMLRENILNNGRTAVIVSHDINLALRFADTLILISKDNDMGVVQPGHIYESRITEKGNTNWHNHRGIIEEETLKNTIRNIIRQN